MFDTHERITGIMPDIFGISTYSIFLGLGMFAGLMYYIADAKKRHARNEGVIIIVAAALVFGMIGSKIPILIESGNLYALLAGKSIVGGLIGGMFGVILIKKLLKINLKLGNIIAPSVALGMSIGRLGCFFGGCCYGIASSWGFDFGDGTLRLPTQLFEAAFHLIAFFVLNYYKGKVKTGGILFKLYILAYFVFRFFMEFIRENPAIWQGMSIYQLISGAGIVYVSIILWRGLQHGRKRNE